MPADNTYLFASDGTQDASLMYVTETRIIGSDIIDVNTIVGVPNKFLASSGTLLPNGQIDPSTITNFYGHIDGSTLVIEGYLPGSVDQGNSVGQVVVIKPTSEWVNLVAAFINTLPADIVKEVAIEDGAVTEPKIAAGAVTTPKIAGGAVTPVERSGGYYVGRFTLTAGSTGNFSVTGVGFRPKMVEFNVLYGASTNTGGAVSFGAADGTNQWAYGTMVGPTQRARNYATDLCIYDLTDGNAVSNAASFVSMDADGFTINRTVAITERAIGFKAWA